VAKAGISPHVSDPLLWVTQWVHLIVQHLSLLVHTFSCTYLHTAFLYKGSCCRWYMFVTEEFVFAFCAVDSSSSEIMGSRTKHRKKVLWWVTGEHFWWDKNNAGTSLGFQIASHYAWIPSLIICQNYLHIAGFSHSIWFCWMSLVAVALTSMGHLSMLCAY